MKRRGFSQHSVGGVRVVQEGRIGGVESDGAWVGHDGMLAVILRTVKPSTIEEVVADLGTVVDDARVRRDRLGLFAALYRRTTIVVQRGIEAGRFEDPERMEELDVRFAQRYFDALAAFTGGGVPTRPWAYAFERSAESEPSVLQHLLLGMNAHIAFDLAIASCETSPGSELAALEGDYMTINRLLAEMVDAVQADVNRTSPWLARLDRWGGPVDERLAASFLAHARRWAWRKAERFAVLPASEQAAWLDRWERQVEALARRICPPPGHRWRALPAAAQRLGGTREEDVPDLLDAIA